MFKLLLLCGNAYTGRYALVYLLLFLKLLKSFRAVLGICEQTA